MPRPARDIANDLVAIDRSAAGRQIHQQITGATGHQPLRRFRFGDMRIGGEHVLGPVFAKLGRNRLRTDAAIANRRQKVIELRIPRKVLEDVLRFELETEPA